MQEEEQRSKTGAGGAEPSNTDTNNLTLWCESGAAHIKSGAGNVDEAVLGNAQLIAEAIAQMDSEVIEVLTENWSNEFKLAVSTSLSTADMAAVLALAPGALLPQPPEHSTRINVEQLPLPSCEEMNLQTKVWVFRVKDKEWFPGLVSEIDTNIWDELPSLWIVKTTCGQKIKARSLEKLRLRT